MKLFVYGTLKRGRALHSAYYMDTRARLLGDDSVRGELYTVGPFPVFFDNGDNMTDVPGEVYEVPRDIYGMIESMETLSGYGVKKVTTRKGNDVRVFVFTDERFRIQQNRIQSF